MEQLVLDCMRNLGVYIDDTAENLLISDYIEDSIMFISFVVELEQAFDIEIPDSYLAPEKLRTLDDVCQMISLLKEKDI